MTSSGSCAPLMLPLAMIVDGNPLVDISVMARSDQTLRLIMEDGKIYENTLKK